MQTSTTHYTLGAEPVTGTGLGVSASDLSMALTGSVAALVFDDQGSEAIQGLLNGLTETAFAQTALNDALTDNSMVKDWQVGEAMAENFLCDNMDCEFPWPDGRDIRKPKSSLPGADLVGFQKDGGCVRFAFGEVKTSAQKKFPPSVFSGTHGLKQQMEDLRERKDIRDQLFRYLGHRATGATWAVTFQAAASRYLQNSCDVRLFGVLIRDVDPHEDDLRARVKSLGQGTAGSIKMELYALYLPLGRIASLASDVVASQPRGGKR